MLDAYPLVSNIPAAYVAMARVVGGTAAVTKVRGDGLSVSYTSTGLYLVTFGESPGKHQHNLYSLNADTPGDVKTHSVVFDVYNSSALTIAFSLYDASGNLHDLAASEWIDLQFWFSRTGLVS